jgi:hypothetical protein
MFTLLGGVDSRTHAEGGETAAMRACSNQAVAFNRAGEYLRARMSRDELAR